MLTYTLILNAWQIEFLKWIAEGCDQNKRTLIYASQGFIRSARKLEKEGLITWDTSDPSASESKIFQLTVKGNAALILVA